MRTRNILLFLTGLVVFSQFTSCQKDTGTPQKTKDSHKTTRMLLDFRTRLALKSTGSMTVDSSEWYVEGLLNLENACNLHENTVDFRQDSVTVNAVNGEIPLDVLDSVLSAFSNMLESYKLAGTDSTYVINLVNITAKQDTGSTSVTLQMDAVLGWWAYHTYQPFIVDLLVKSAWWGGKCADSNPPFYQDARAELEYRLNHPNYSLVPGYFTGVQTVFIGADYEPSAPGYPNPGPNSHQLMMFWSYDLPFGSNLCLPVAELDYYLSTFPYLLTKYRPDNLTFSDVYVDRTECGHGGGFTDYAFNYYMHYGTFVPREPD